MQNKNIFYIKILLSLILLLNFSFNGYSQTKVELNIFLPLSNGDTGRDINDVNEMMTKINEKFSSTSSPIEFDYCINEIDDVRLLDDPSLYWDGIVGHAVSDPQKINLLISHPDDGGVNPLEGPGGATGKCNGLGGHIGYFKAFNIHDIAEDNIEGWTFRNTFSHEVAHCLGLQHTFGRSQGTASCRIEYNTRNDDEVDFFLQTLPDDGYDDTAPDWNIRGGDSNFEFIDIYGNQIKITNPYMIGDCGGAWSTSTGNTCGDGGSPLLFELCHCGCDFSINPNPDLIKYKKFNFFLEDFISGVSVITPILDWATDINPNSTVDQDFGYREDNMMSYSDCVLRGFTDQQGAKMKTYATNYSGSTQSCCNENSDLTIYLDINPNLSYWFGTSAASEVTTDYATSETRPNGVSYMEFSGMTITVINGDGPNNNLIINENSGFNNCTINMPRGSSIIQEGGHLYIENTTIQSCSGFWEGIVTEFDRLLYIVSSTLTSAVNCVSIVENSRIQIVDGTFTNSTRGILIFDEFLNYGFRGNQFSNLAVGLINASPIFFYPTNNAGQMIVGPDSRSIENLTTFTNCHTAIINDNDMLRLAGIDIDQSAAIGISIEDNSFSGMAFVQLQHITISNSEDAMDIIPTLDRFSFYSSQISHCQDGFIVNGGPTFMLSDVDFDHVVDPFEFVAPSPNYAPNDIHRLSNCDFSNCSGDQIVRITGANNMIVSLNSVTNILQDNSLAFDLDLTRNMAFRWNTNVELSNTNQTGIFSNGGNINTYRANNINGNSGGTGLHLDGDNQSFLCNNEISNTDIGLELEGTASLRVISNGFNDTDDGINITGSPIGDQVHHENCWNNSDAECDAALRVDSEFFYNPDEPCYIADNQVPGLWFMQPGPNDADPPSPGSAGCNMDPNVIVEDEDELVEEDCCPNGCYGPPCCTMHDLPTCADLVEYFSGGASNSLNKGQQWSLYQEISQWWAAFTSAIGMPGLPIPPELVNCWQDITPNGNDNSEGGSETEENSSSTTISNTTVSTIVAQGQLIHQLESAQSYASAENEQLNNLNTEITLLTEQLDQLDIRENESEIVVLKGRLQTKFQNIKELKAIKAIESSSVSTTIVEEVNVLPEPFDFVTHQNNIISVQAKLLSTNLPDITESDHSDIIAAANSCAYEVGQAAYTARSLYYKLGGPHPSEYNDEILCQAVDARSNRNIANELDVTIHPNPTMNKVIINFAKVVHGIRLQITNLQGTIIDEYNIKDNTNSFEVDLSNYTEGMYIFNLKEKDLPPIIKKVAKVTN